jgi:hypothetical protein
MMLAVPFLQSPFCSCVFPEQSVSVTGGLGSKSLPEDLSDRRECIHNPLICNKPAKHTQVLCKI